MKKAGEAFAQVHPAIRVITESHGSRTCARQISELGKAYDVFGSADYAVIDNLLIPDHAAFSVRFATNEMAIVRGEGAPEITSENWCERLLEPDVKWGHSDPNQDPCGYRTHLVIQLAERHYRKSDLCKKMLAHKGRVVRPKEVDLLALIDAGEIDYLFIYRSVAEQHKLKYLILPDEVNLKDSARKELYARAAIRITGKKPGQMITKKGAPMVYGVAIPRNAPNPRAALAFVKFLLGPDGRKIMKDCGQGTIAPGICEQFDALPDELKTLAGPAT